MTRSILFIIILLVSFREARAQASWETFGQNRVQYRTFSWKYYDSTHFRAFYYDYGKANALYALNLAEQELNHIVYMMGGRLNKKLNIILYNSFGDYRQTNLGRKNDELNQANGGKVDVTGDNIPVYFNGDHNHLVKQIRSGIARAIKDNMLFGDNIKDVVKNAVKMNLPEWYTSGYVAFIAEEWSSDKQASLQALLETSHKKFNELATNNPLLGGQAFWHFLSEGYGENAVSNLLYLTRYRENVNTAIEIVCKKSAKEVFAECASFYNKSSATLNSQDTVTCRRIFTEVNVAQGAQYGPFAVSPSGRELAYVEKKDGQYRIYIQDVRYHKTFLIIDGGIRAMQELADPDYPMLCWSPSGNKLAALYQQKGMLQLRIFTTGKRIMEKRRIPPNRIDRITGMCFMGDESMMAVTGIRKGQSDLYTLTIRNSRFTQITNDLYDDKSPAYVENGLQSGILFLSNRSTPFLSTNQSDDFTPKFNLFLYSEPRGTNLLALSANPKGTIHDPMQYGMEAFSYLEDNQGQCTRKVVSLVKRQETTDTLRVDDAAPVPFTVLNQSYIHNKSSVAEIVRDQKKYRIYVTPYAALADSDKAFRDMSMAMKDSVTEDTLSAVFLQPAQYYTPFDEEQDSSIVFQEAFQKTQKSTSRFAAFVQAAAGIKAKGYRSNFYPDYIQTSLDNTLLFTRYQPIGSQFNNVQLSGFLTSTLTDVMEDYKLTGGARLGADFSSLDYFFRFANYRRRIDWDLLFFHSRSSQQGPAPLPYYSPYLVFGKRSMEYLQTNFTYPIDMLRSIRFQLGVRYDQTRYLAKEQYSLAIPNQHTYWMVGKLEYVYDNTINPLLNIWKGTRAKVFTEYQWQLDGSKKGFVNVGFDARHYKTLYKNIILASRFAGASSTGKARILYYLGGVDNPLNAQFDNRTVVNIDANYAFQSLATNLRGYKQGARNGSGFMVWNEEIRLPIYNTFFRRPIKSGLIRNLQWVAFADAGLAMSGFYPTADNIVNQIRIRDNQSNISVYLERDFGLGYGTGLRTRFLGYFVRSDFAWSIAGSRKPMLHLSLATDF
jgi:hypothetical protein